KGGRATQHPHGPASRRLGPPCTASLISVNVLGFDSAEPQFVTGIVEVVMAKMRAAVFIEPNRIVLDEKRIMKPEVHHLVPAATSRPLISQEVLIPRRRSSARSKP